ncbi:MAG: Hemolysin C [Opitutia bacterium UBA7350]|nr:MAG: Hemolysin C [Opitutae bacterium UBA7350]
MIFVLIFLIVYALLVFGETSLVMIRYGKVARVTLEKLKCRKGLLKIILEGKQAAEALRFGKVFCVMGLGFQICFFVWKLLPQASFAAWVIYLLIGTTTLLLIYCLGEFLPRALALRYPAKALRLGAPVLALFKLLLVPMRKFSLERVIFKWLKVTDVLPNPLDIGVQLRALGHDNTTLTLVVRSIINRSIQMQDLVVHDVLLPRNEVIFYDLNEDVTTNLERMKRAGHTRYPLCRGDLDECQGIIHIKDIFRSEEGELLVKPDALMRPTASFLLETPLEDALQRMLRTKIHMGLVHDDFGGVLGVVTLERILEELVGDIQDEFDSEDDPIEELQESEQYLISGQAPIHEVESRLGVEVINQAVSTFGGLIASELGRIPEAGELLEVSGMRIEITRVDDRRILTTRVKLVAVPDEQT